MRKKWTYVAIVSMMLGMAPVFTGCVDTDEPAGIEQLRGAKAELLKAKAAVEQARVALIEADVRYRDAETAAKQAEADKKAAEAKYAELVNQLKEAENAAEIEKIQADLEAYLEQVANAREEAQKRQEILMQQLEEDLLEAQRSYEVLQNAIEIAKATCSDKDKVTIQDLQNEIDWAYDALYGTDGVKKALFTAQQNLIDAKALDAKGYEVSVGADGKPTQGKENWQAALEVKVNHAKSEQEAAEQLLKDLQGYSSLEVEGTDWKAEVDKVIADKEALEAQIEAKNAELAQAQAAPSYVEADQAVNGIWKECDATTAGAVQKEPGKYYVLVQPGTAYILSEAQGKLLTEQKKQLFSYAKSDISTEITDQMITAINATSGVSYAVTDFAYPAKEKISWVDPNDATITKPTSNADYPQDIQDIVDLYDKWVKDVNAAIVDPNDAAEANAHMEVAKAAEEAAQKAYDAAEDKWSNVLDIISKQSAVQVPQASFQTSTTAYNTAYTALKSAVDAWNEAYDKAYQDAKDEKDAELTLDIYVEAITDNNIPAVTGFDVEAAKKQWDGLSPRNQTMANFEDAVNENCSAVPNGDNLATVQEKAWAQIENYVDKIKDINWSGHAQIEQAGKEAVENDAFDKDNKLADALTKAVTGMNNAVYDNVAGGTVSNSLVNAINKFQSDAADYVQAVDSKALNLNALIGILKDGNYIGYGRDSYYAADATVKVGTKYTLSVNDITTDEISKATKTTFDKTANTDAILLKVSNDAFGMNEARYIVPSRAEVEAAGALATNTSAIANLFRAQDAVKGLQDQIDAADDLKALSAELTADKAAFEKAIADQYTKNFSEMEAAIATAQKNFDDTDKVLQAEKDKFSNLTIEVAKLEAQVAAKESLEGTLKTIAWNNLGIEFPDEQYNPDYTKPTKYDPETFAEDLAEAIKEQELAVAEAEQKVAEAEANLALAQETEYDGVAYYQMLVDIAQISYDRANERYQKALNDFNKAMEILGATTDEEQPAE